MTKDRFLIPLTRALFFSQKVEEEVRVQYDYISTDISSTPEKIDPTNFKNWPF